MDITRDSTCEQYTSAVDKNLPHRRRDQIINDELYWFIMSISLGFICQTISVFGVVSNLINIVVFVKQGFRDKVNISLLGLTVSDMTSLVFLMWSNIYFTTTLRDTTLTIVAHEFQIISGMWPHIIFTRTTGWITAFISLERCMCVILPLKVKTIFTRRRHITSMLTIFIVTISCSTLAYVSLGLDWKFFPERNATLIGLVYRMDVHKRKVTDSVGYAVSGVFMPMTCFFSVLIFTIVLIVKLNQQATWRHSSSLASEEINYKPGRNMSLNVREQKVAKMIVFISAIFIICYLPAVGIFIAGYLEPELSYDGVYRNMFMVTLSISCTTEAINSSINIFIYSGMSTKYRETLLTRVLSRFNMQKVLHFLQCFCS